mmetsp:Transcript_8563/g.31636  ORF Transcript_8563/g.31636 Transcript_8563/m.31636 type:complete len:279 (+) Transcript_8563:66-902(+)
MRQSTSSIRAQGALSWRSLPLRLRSLMPDLVARCQVEWPSTEHAWCHKVLVHRIRYVCGPVCDRTLASRNSLEDKTQPRAHSQAAVLQFLDLKGVQVVLAQLERVEATTGVDVTHSKLIEYWANNKASAVTLRKAHSDNLYCENCPEVRVARALGSQRSNRTREGDRCAVIRSAQSACLIPRNASANLCSPSTGDPKHSVAAVHDLTLSVLRGSVWDDWRLALATWVCTPFRESVRMNYNRRASLWALSGRAAYSSAEERACHDGSCHLYCLACFGGS